MAEQDLEATFHALKAILRPFEPKLVKVHDLPDNYYLDTAFLQKNRKPIFFGAVRRGRRYVSYHLMPVYIWPNLLAGVSNDLKRRMQGKSCFNFSAPRPELFDELATLTKCGFEQYREAGYVY